MMDLSQDKYLIYKSRYRGMKELDLIFQAFQPHIPTLSLDYKKKLNALLDEEDHDLYQWLVLGHAVQSDYQPLVAMIRQQGCL